MLSQLNEPLGRRGREGVPCVPVSKILLWSITASSPCPLTTQVASLRDTMSSSSATHTSVLVLLSLGTFPQCCSNCETIEKLVINSQIPQQMLYFTKINVSQKKECAYRRDKICKHYTSNPIHMAFSSFLDYALELLGNNAMHEQTAAKDLLTYCSVYMPCFCSNWQSCGS